MTTDHTPAQSDPLMVELREGTKDLHTRAERHPVQAGLVRGHADRAAYTAYLAQLHHIHAALEGELARRAGSPVLAPVVADHFRASLAAEDLATLGETEPGAPVEPVAQFAAAIADESDEALLGMHYVLEGSTNGGRFIALAVGKSLEPERAGAVRYLDPYGELQRQRWGEYCGAMGRLTLEPQARARVLDGAKRMFGLIIDTFEAMA